MPVRPKMEEPVEKDPFADMYNLANKSLSSKTAPKPNPFDDNMFSSPGTGYKPDSFSGTKSQNYGNQKAAEDLFGGSDNFSDDFFGGTGAASKAADDLFGGGDNMSQPSNMYVGHSNDMLGGMGQPKGPSNDFDFF